MKQISALLTVLILATFSALAQFPMTFDTPVPLGSSQAPGVWYPDRQVPAILQSTYFDGGNRLQVGVSSADFNAGNNFYNTQGRKYDVTSTSLGDVFSVDLYIPAAWQTMNARGDMWLTAADSVGANAAFPIIGFQSYVDGTTFDPTFHVWDDNVGFVNIATAITYDSWYNLSITRESYGFMYAINGTEVYDDVVSGVASVNNVMIQDRNYNNTYSSYWDNLVAPNPTPTPEPSTLALAGLGGFALLLLRQRRK